MQEFLLRHFMISTHQPIVQVRLQCIIPGWRCRSLLQGSSCAEVFCNLRKLLHFSLLFSEMTRYRYTRKTHSALLCPHPQFWGEPLPFRVSNQTSNEKRTAVSVSLLPVYTHVFVNNSDVCCSFYCCRQLSIVKTSVCPALSNTHHQLRQYSRARTVTA